MKKLLLIILGSFAAQSLAMNECEKVYDRGKELSNKSNSEDESHKTAEFLRYFYRKLCDKEISNEILEKIFTYVNHNSAVKIIRQIEEIKIRISYDSERSIRQFTDEKFKEISTIIKNAPIYTYARIALSMALSRVFSKFEKLHFLGIMLINEHLTLKQRVIFEFLAKQILEFEQFKTKGMPRIRKKDFMKYALNLSDIANKETIVKFLFNNDIGWPESTIGKLISTKNKNIYALIRFALKNGADINGLVSCYKLKPLDFCMKMLKLWHDKNWTNGSQSDEKILQIVFSIGSGFAEGYSKENPASPELIKYNIEYYEELIELLSSYSPKEIKDNEEACDSEIIY